MSASLFRLVIGCILLSTTAFSQHKKIIISDSLSANSDKLSVKQGAQWPGRISRFRFGDYAVVSSKTQGGSTTEKGGFSRATVESKYKFSFVIADNSGDSAEVIVLRNTTTTALHEIEITSHFSVGDNELREHSYNLSAFIVPAADTAEKWLLQMDTTVGNAAEEKCRSFINNGTRTMNIAFTSSDKNHAPKPHFIAFPTFPALGYEFFENERPLAAVQYNSGGTNSKFKNIVWIARDLDNRMKLILAAAMTTVLQVKLNETSIYD